MDCKYCVHDGVCYMQETCNDIEEQLREFGCKDFKDKSRIIELPCEIDDPVFVIPTKENGRKEITPMACLGFQIGRPSNTATCFDEKNKLYSAGFDMFGKSLFLSREEAEKVFEDAQNED